MPKLPDAEVLRRYLNATALQQANDEVWNDLRSGIDQACQDLQDTLNRARSRFD